ncbi:hypothetical protein Baya_7105 [Bagarius yarrelli]|uniref:Uncharacterized protein n=1 Tax=Bagarius yarrelli TaxID=175774 RepID=A0A556TZA4_BAGYA|nr:hypothetical protein Baya_7105 [Bagarius yarrelli]
MTFRLGRLWLPEQAAPVKVRDKAEITDERANKQTSTQSDKEREQESEWKSHLDRKIEISLKIVFESDSFITTTMNYTLLVDTNRGAHGALQDFYLSFLTVSISAETSVASVSGDRQERAACWKRSVCVFTPLPHCRSHSLAFTNNISDSSWRTDGVLTPYPSVTSFSCSSVFNHDIITV